MRNNKTQGFTLIELLIVIAIIGILAAVLIPNLLNARARAFDTAAQTCLKEISTQEEMRASVDPWEYTASEFVGAAAAPHSNEISSCDNVLVETANTTTMVDHDGDPTTAEQAVPGTSTAAYAYHATHSNGANRYYIEIGSGVKADNP